MTQIVFTTLEYKNFRSVGNTPIKLNLNTHKTTLISGTNGSGKTSVLSALCFALFNRGYGPINKPALINSINQKQLLVTLEFEIGKKKYKIIRGMKPNIFEIHEDDTLISQDPTIKDYQKVLEQQILKFNYRAFTQVVAVGGGSDYTPFMRLSAKDRREFVEDLLDIRVFSTMGSLVKDQHKVLKDELKMLDYSLKSIKEKIELQDSFINKMKKEKAESADKIETLILEAETDNVTIHDKLLIMMVESTNLKVFVDMHSDIDDELSELKRDIRQSNIKLEKNNSEIDKYDSMVSCPTCLQNIDENHKHSTLEDMQNMSTSFSNELNLLLLNEEKVLNSLTSLEKELQLYADITTRISKLNTEMFNNTFIIKKYKAQLLDLKSDTGNIDDESDKLKAFAKEYITLAKTRKESLKLQQYQELVQQILSDSGIKSKVIKNFIPTINYLINSKLDALDLFLSMSLDETFNETFKARHRDTFTYDSFSEGQRRRIDIAIMLAWCEIAKAKNSLSCNVLFLDEIDAPLDSAGADLLHATLKTVSSDNIFIISHKSDQMADKVDNVIEFELKNNFTQLKS